MNGRQVRWRGWGFLLGGLLGLAAMAQAADRPGPGLMWNRSGLPLVFPLEVRTEAGDDYYLTLTDAATGAPALAAFFEGGAFFRVLAPPGTYELNLATGETWQDEAALFGDTTRRIGLPAPLTFEILDAATKGGHLVDLTARDTAGAIAPIVTPLNSCQGVRLTDAPRPQAPFDDLEGYGTRIPDDGDLIHHPDGRFDPERLTGRDTPVRPTDHAPYFSRPRARIGEYPC